MSRDLLSLMGVTLHHDDCVARMRLLPDASVDAIVTDPPYELGFMGKGWDKSGIANNVEMWREALRVLKPGGHLLAFSGTRTYHRMTCAIEDAGFEVRDQMAWTFGSGFPKSLDVSKAIDKRGGNPGLTATIGAALKAARLSRGLSASECDRVFCGGTTNWSWFEGRPNGQRAPTPDTFAKIAEAWPEVAALAEAVAEAEREVVATVEMRDTSAVRLAVTASAAEYDAAARRSVDITAPATDAARQWQGWGTALKPAWEPICVARKPLIGTVAENVLAHGTGALNIDGCRVEGGERPLVTSDRRLENNTYAAGLGGSKGEGTTTVGRWPANLIHDGSDEVLGAFPQTGPSSATLHPGTERGSQFGQIVSSARTTGYSDTGSAARFFYCAKASKSDRGDTNTHPTVKPTDLMRYLCRLVTPPGGVVLDPFMGSGSTGKAAVLEGFQFVGIDMTAEYVAIAEARIAAALTQA